MERTSPNTETKTANPMTLEDIKEQCREMIRLSEQAKGE